MVKPVYPQALRLLGVQNEVLVDFVVDTTGRVRNAFVVRSAHPGFSERALEAVRQWVFTPGVKDYHPVFTHMRVPVRFQLTDVHTGPRPPPESASAPSGDPPAGP